MINRLLLALLLTAAPAAAQDYRVWVASEAVDRMALVRFGPDGARLEREFQVGMNITDPDGPHGVEVSPDGTRAAAEFTVQGAYVQDDAGLPPARGQRYTLHAGTFFNIHAGQLRRVSEYANLQELIAQVAVG